MKTSLLRFAAGLALGFYLGTQAIPWIVWISQPPPVEVQCREQFNDQVQWVEHCWERTLYLHERLER